MKIRFHLAANERVVGTLEYNWESPFLPRPGDSVVVWLLYTKEMFQLSEEYDSDLPVEEYLEQFFWKVDSISWGDTHDPETPTLFLEGE